MQAQSPSASPPPATAAQTGPTLPPPVPQAIFSALWRTDGSFTSEIHIKNSLVTGPIQVTPVVYMADGTEYDLPSITLGTAGIATVNINQALASAPPAVAAHLSQYGSAALRYQYPWGGVVRGQMVVVNIPQSLIFTGPLNAVDNAAAAAPQGPQGIETLWWRRDPGVTGFVSLANTTDAPIQASVEATGALGTPGDNITVRLAPHATQILDLDEIASAVPGLENQSGGLSVHYNGADGAVMMLAGLENVQEGYSATLPPYPEPPTPAAATTPILYGAAGMMIGNPDPMMGFPSGTRFTPYAVLRNLTAKAIAVNPEVYYMAGASPVAVPLPVQLLKPNETRQLDLMGMFPASLKNFSGLVNLTLSYTGQSGEVAMAGGSVDQTGTYVFETNPEGLGQTMSREMTYWTTAGGSDTMISLWNSSGQAEDVVVQFYISGGQKPYQLPVHLESHALYNIDVMQLAMSGLPDANGTMLPMNSRGSATVESTKGENLPIQVGLCTGIYNVQTGTCGTQCWNCNGYESLEVTPSPTACLVGTTMQFAAMAYYSNGQYYNVTTSCQWSSSNTSLATVETKGQSNPGLMTSLAVGAPNITALLEQQPAGGRICNCTGCPTRNFSGITTPNLDSLVFTITSGGVTNDPYGVVAKSPATVQIQAKSPTGTVPDTLFAGSFPFYVLNLNTALGEAAPSSVSFSSGTTNANVTLVSASGTSSAPSSVRQIYVFASANDTEFFPYIYWKVMMDEEVWHNCNVTTCPDTGAYACKTSCDPSGLPKGSKFVAITQSGLCSKGIVLEGKPETGGSWSALTSTNIQDCGPLSGGGCTNPYWFNGNIPTMGGCLSDALMASLGIPQTCSSGTGWVTWRFQ